MVVAPLVVAGPNLLSLADTSLNRLQRHVPSRPTPDDTYFMLTYSRSLADRKLFRAATDRAYITNRRSPSLGETLHHPPS